MPFIISHRLIILFTLVKSSFPSNLIKFNSTNLSTRIFIHANSRQTSTVKQRALLACRHVSTLAPQIDPSDSPLTRYRVPINRPSRSLSVFISHRRHLPPGNSISRWEIDSLSSGEGGKILENSKLLEISLGRDDLRFEK